MTEPKEQVMDAELKRIVGMFEEAAGSAEMAGAAQVLQTIQKGLTALRSYEHPVERAMKEENNGR